MLAIRFAIQNAVKAVARAAGLEVRYGYQFPLVTDSRIYQPWLEPGRVACILDVGANVGQSASRFAKSFPASVVHSFEPFPGAYAQLQRVAEASGGRIKAYPVACGERDGTFRIRADTASSASQLNRLDPNSAAGTDGATAPGASVEIPVRSLDSFCAEHGLTAIDVLKTDTEGFDAKLLTGAEQLLASGAVRCVVSEVGFIDDRQHTPFDDVYRIMTRHGFELAGVYEITYLRNRRCDFANVLFVRRGGRAPVT
jgi:FkbM family methyltransferase